MSTRSVVFVVDDTNTIDDNGLIHLTDGSYVHYDGDLVGHEIKKIVDSDGFSDFVSTVRQASVTGGIRYIDASTEPSVSCFGDDDSEGYTAVYSPGEMSCTWDHEELSGLEFLHVLDTLNHRVVSYDIYDEERSVILLED